MNFLESLKRAFGLTPAGPVDNPTEAMPVATPAPPAATGLPPAAQSREAVLRFILGRLRTYQNEPDAAPMGIKLSILCPDEEAEALYRVVLWSAQPGRFQKELDRLLADNYIQLPKDWRFEYAFFRDALPDSSYRSGNLALTVLDAAKSTGTLRRARITAVVGQLEQAEYLLDPAQKTSFCIGRGRSGQTGSGRVRTNDIVFLNETDPGFDPQRGAVNNAVSRAHATIRYEASRQQYSLLVDAGGLPASGNKTKILRADNRLERADMAGVGYPLHDGDQIELGGGAVLLIALYE